MKKMVSLILAVFLVVGFIPTGIVPALADSGINVPIIINDARSFCGASIETSQLTEGDTYRIHFDVTAYSDHNGGFRVRYLEGINNYVHNDTVNNASSSASATANGVNATQVPALFPSGTLAGGQRAVLVVEFTYGEPIPDLEPLVMDYIGLFGLQGTNNFKVNSVTVYDVTNGDSVIGYAERFFPNDLPGPGFAGPYRYDLGNPNWGADGDTNRGWQWSNSQRLYFLNAFSLVLEIPYQPMHDLQLIFQAEGSAEDGGWGWYTTTIPRTLWQYGRITLDASFLSSANGYDKVSAPDAGRVNLIIGNYSDNWNALDITAAYLIGGYSAEYFSSVEVLYQNSFETDNGGFNLRGSGSANVSRVQGSAQEGSSALYVTGRTDGWHGTALGVSQFMIPGETYYVEAYVKTDAGQSVQLSVEYNGDNDASNSKYQNFASVTCTDGNWTLIEGAFQARSDKSLNTLYFEMWSSVTADFYIDNVTIWGPEPPVEPTDAPTLYPVGSSLREVYQNLFSLGVEVTTEQLRDELTLWHILQHYDSVTLEALASDYILTGQPDAETMGVDFTEIDACFAIARAKGLTVRAQQDGQPAWYTEVVSHIESDYPDVVVWDTDEEVIDITGMTVVEVEEQIDNAGSPVRLIHAAATGTSEENAQFYAELMAMLVEKKDDIANITFCSQYELFEQTENPLFTPRDAYYSVLRAPLAGTAQTGDHVVILQAYASGTATDGAISHSFVELYNPTDAQVILEDWSLQVQNGTDTSNATATQWEKFDFPEGAVIAPYSSYLVQMQEKSPSARYIIPNADANWTPAGFTMSNRAFSVALVSHQDALTQTITIDEMLDVVDLLGAINTESQGDAVLNCEETRMEGISKQKSARRVNFTDTDDNSADFVSMDYRSTGSTAMSAETLAKVRPHWSGDGDWGRNTSTYEKAGLTFSEEAGLYPEGTELDLALTTDASSGVIWYTTNGKNPVPYAPGSKRYTAPIHLEDRTDEANYLSAIGDGTDIFSRNINNQSQDNGGTYRKPTSNIFKGNVIKAQVFSTDGTALSKLETKSYIIRNELSDAFGDLPIVSITMDEADLFSVEKGIFVYGHNEQRGAEWERPAYLEFFEQDGTIGVSQTMGMRINGAYSRRWPQKSLRFYASASRDPDHPSVDYDIFAGEALSVDGEEIDEYRRFILRNFGNDYGNAHMRDLMVSKLAQGVNAPTMDGRYAVALINGEFWGLYELRERVDEYYLQSKYNLPDVNLALLENPGWGIQDALPEDYEPYVEAKDWFLSNLDLSDPDAYAEAQRYVDIDNLIDYFIFEIYGDNSGDWPGNNMNIWRYKTADYPAVGAPLGSMDGRWRYIIKDLDFSFGQYDTAPSKTRVFDKVFRLIDSNNQSAENIQSALFFRTLCTNSEFVEKFIGRFFDLMNTHLSHAYVTATVDELALQIRSVVEQYRERWSLGSVSSWEGQLQSIKTYSSQRRQYVIRDLLAESILKTALPALDAAEAKTLALTTDTSKGTLRVNSMDITAATPGVSNPGSWSGTYLTDLTQTIEAVPEFGYEFVKFVVNEEDETSNPLSLVMTDDTTVAAVYAVAELEQKTSPVIINQVYSSGNGSSSAISHSFIELYNTSDEEVDLGAYSIQVASSSASNVTTGAWSVLPLTGETIGANSYFLIVCTQNVNSTNPRYEIADWDMEWDTAIGNRAFSVALVAAQTALTNTITQGEWLDVLDFVTALNDDSVDIARNYQGDPVNDITKQKSARRMDFQDTDDNAADFESLDYRSTGISDERLAEVSPRWSGYEPPEEPPVEPSPSPSPSPSPEPPSGGDNGGTGGGGGSVVTPAPTAAPAPTSVPGAGKEEAVIQVPVAVDTTSGAVTIQMDAGTAESLIADANETAQAQGGDSKPTVTLDLSNVENAQSAVLDAATAQAFAEADVGVVIKLPNAAITLDPETLAALTTESGTAAISIEAAVVPMKELSGMQAAQVKGYETVINIDVFAGDKKIDVPLTISMPYALKPNEDPKAVRVWHLDDSGNLTAISGVYDAATGMITFSVSHQSYYVVGYDPVALWENIFKDVSDDAWFYEAVAHANYYELFNGDGKGRFMPTDTMTRGMFVTVLWNLEGKPVPQGTKSFGDVDKAAWYSSAVMWAAENGIITETGAFEPQRAITRQEMAVMLWNYASFKDYELPKNRELPAFSDWKLIDASAETAAKELAEAGVMSGSNNQFMPQKDSSRAEVAALLKNFLRFVVGK